MLLKDWLRTLLVYSPWKRLHYFSDIYVSSSERWQINPELRKMKQVDVAYGSAQRLGIERWQSGANKGACVQTLNG